MPDTRWKRERERERREENKYTKTIFKKKELNKRDKHLYISV